MDYSKHAPVFPHKILREIRFEGRSRDWPFQVGTWHELVIDELGRAWVATNGILGPWLWDKTGEVVNYHDPRTAYEAFAIADGDDINEVTSFGWFTKEGELYEECPAEEEMAGFNEIHRIPPDRRDDCRWGQKR